MRILFVTQWFDPEPAFKGLAFAKALEAAGHDVQVLTGFPNYPEGNLYPGFRMRPLLRESHDGLEVVRVALYPSHDRSAFRRILNYLSFAATASTLGLLAARRPDVVYVYLPPATSMAPALLSRLLRGTPFVLDVQDLWPDTVAATGMVRNRLALSVLGGACRAGYVRASRVVVLSPGFRAALESRGVDPERIRVVYNWAPEEKVLEEPAVTPDGWPHGEGLFRVLFAGNLGRAQGLSSVIQAARILRDRCPNVRIVLAGDGVESVLLRESAADLGNVVFLGRLARESAARCLKLAEALLVHLAPEPLFDITIPSKIQTYLAAGRPIVAGVRGDAADLVSNAGAGVPCTPGDPSSIAEAVEKLASMPKLELEKMGERGRTYYREVLSERRAVETTLGILAEAVEGRRQRRGGRDRAGSVESARVRPSGAGDAGR